MLLRNDTRIIEKVIVDLYFDDNTEKHVEVAEKDVVKIEYNDAGCRKSIVGKVADIINKPSPIPHIHQTNLCKPCCPPPYNKGGYFIIDGSDVYLGNRVIVYFSNILDCEMIERYDETLFVKTTPDGPVNRIRMIDGVLEVSQDLGETFIEAVPKDKNIVKSDGTVNALSVIDGTLNISMDNGENWVPITLLM